MSLVNNLPSGAVLLNLERSQAREATATSRLSSGLRINTSADDPSGLAISQELQAQVNGFDQATQNVQNANSALSVADGALSTVADLLQRIRSLAVEAANDVSSTDDRNDLQTETAQLLLEINRIAQNTTFNGTALLDGSHAGFQAAVPASLLITSNAALASAAVATSSSVGTAPAIVNGNLSSPAVPANVATGESPTGWTLGPGAFFFKGTIDTPADPIPPDGDAVIRLGFGEAASQTVSDFSPGTYRLTYVAAADRAGFGSQPLEILVDGSVAGTSVLPAGAGYSEYTTTFTVTTPGTHTITFRALSVGDQYALFTDVSLSAAPTTVPVGSSSSLLITSAVAANANFQTTGPGTAGLGGVGTTDGTIAVQVINTGTSIAAQERFFDSATGLASVSPILLAPNSTSALFDNVAITLGNFTAPDTGAESYLKVEQAEAAYSEGTAFSVQAAANEGATISVAIAAANTNVLRISNVNLATSLGAEDTIGQIDFALASVLAQRASLGALLVRLEETATVNQVSAVNLQVAESSLTDVDVPAETTVFTQRQVLSSVGFAVLAQTNALNDSVLQLFR